MHTDTWTSFLHVAQVLATLNRYSAWRSLWQRYIQFCYEPRSSSTSCCLSEGLIESIAWSGIRSLSACDSPTSLVDIPEITVIDDTACCFTAAAAEAPVAKVARGAEQQRVIFSSRSLQLVYSPCLSLGRAGKLQPLLPSAGEEPNSNTPSWQASIAFAGDGILPCTPDYKHLGRFFKDPNCA